MLLLLLSRQHLCPQSISLEFHLNYRPLHNANNKMLILLVLGCIMRIGNAVCSRGYKEGAPRHRLRASAKSL